MSDPNSFIAYEIHPSPSTAIEPAPIARDWMDNAHLRHPYRCLPLVIANQSGWVLRSPASFRAYWYGGPLKEDVEIQFDGPPDTRILSHFGCGRHHLHDAVPLPHAPGDQPVGEGAKQLDQGWTSAARRGR